MPDTISRLCLFNDSVLVFKSAHKSPAFFGQVRSG
jgi:hypothetical protein